MTLYFRLLSKNKAAFKWLYESAALRYAAGMQMRLLPTDLFHGQIAFMGVYEEELSELVQDLGSQPGGLMIDVGANYGYFSLLWCAAKPTNKVMAIEASPVNLSPLRHNIEENYLADRVTVHSWAASSHQGTSTFDLGSLEETGWGGLASGLASNVVTVETRRLDDEFAGQEVELLKVDCEGADAWVLEGASGLLAEGRIHNVVFEENLVRQQALGISEGQAVMLLEKHGYSCKLLDNDPWIKTYRAVRPLRRGP